MRRTTIALLVAVAALGALSASSYAGPAAIDADGNFLMVDGELLPPIAGTRARPQPVTLTFHMMYGNYRTGAQPPSADTLAVRTPRGMTVDPTVAARCALPKSDADITSTRCGAATRVGSGTALADARSFGIANPIPATIAVFNGAAHSGHPTLILQGKAMLGGTPAVMEYDFEYLNRPTGPYGLHLITFHPYTAPPANPNAGFITLNKLDVTIGKTVTRKGVKAGYFRAPTTCTSAGWASDAEFALNTGAVLKATNVVPCVK
jgi:hypothetical protein